jgi:hypothetical protein
MNERFFADLMVILNTAMVFGNLAIMVSNCRLRRRIRGF